MTGMPAARLGLRDRGRARGRPRRRPRPVRPGDRPHAGDLRRAAPVPGRDPVRDRERDDRHRRRRAHGRHAGPGACGAAEADACGTSIEWGTESLGVLAIAVLPALAILGVPDHGAGRGPDGLAVAAGSAAIDVGLLLSIALIAIVGLRPGIGVPGGFEQWNLVPFRDLVASDATAGRGASTRPLRACIANAVVFAPFGFFYALRFRRGVVPAGGRHRRRHVPRHRDLAGGGADGPLLRRHRRDHEHGRRGDRVRDRARAASDRLDGWAAA